MLFCLCLCFISKNAFTAPIVWNESEKSKLNHDHFVGRHLVLDGLKEKFRQNDQYIITLVGSTGIGKTKLAKKYAENHYLDYDIIWHFDAENDLSEQFKKLAISLNQSTVPGNINTNLAEEEIVKLTKTYLQNTNLSWLLIFDSAKNKDELVDYVPALHVTNNKDISKHNLSTISKLKPTRLKNHILITSKNPFTWSNIMKIDKFNRSESIDLVTQLINDNIIFTETDANILAEIFSDYPLAVAQAANYIKSNPGQTIDEYVILLNAKRKELITQRITNENKLFKEMPDYQINAHTALSLVINKLREESPLAFELLILCSHIDNKNIPDALLKQYAITITNSDVDNFRRAIAALLKYSLIEQSNSKVMPNYVMHEFIQHTTLDLISKNERKIYLSRALGVIATFIPDKIDIIVPLISSNPEYAIHLKTIYKNAKQMGIFNNDLLTIQQRLLEYYLPGKRDYKLSEKLITEIKETASIIKKEGEIDPIIEVRFSVMKSAFLSWQNIDLNASFTEALYAKNLIENINDVYNYNEEYLMVYNRLAQLSNLRADNISALKYANLGEEVLLKTSNLAPDKQPGNQDSLYQVLAKIYADNQNFEKALEYANKSIAKLTHNQNQILPGDTPIYLTKAVILLKMGKYEEAYGEIAKLYNDIPNIFGDANHTYRIAIEIYFAYASFLANKSEQNSKKQLQKSINSVKNLLGTDSKKSRYLAYAHMYLGEILEKEKNLEEARIAYEIALPIYKNSYYNSENISVDDLSRLYINLASIYVKLNDNVEAQHYLNQHKASFGINHSGTYRIASFMLDNGMKIGY